MNRLAVQALEKMETRKFNSKSKGRREGSCGALDTLSSSSTSDCAICLEKYIDGEVTAELGPRGWGKVSRGAQDRVPCPFPQLCRSRRASRSRSQGDDGPTSLTAVCAWKGVATDRDILSGESH